MATRRSQQSQEPLSSTTEKDISSSSKPSDTSPAVPTDVIIKLLVFSVAMIGGPIGMYFLTVNTVFSGNATFAGATAAITANVVLFAYIFVAWRDDQEEQHARKEKKAQ